ncbi:MAG TPA: FAD-binding oxidoreductase [Patescibacteria group bacterium]|nr:FAD-binding oxidoreductase [Patescibacteria group bacterium]
MKVVKAKLEERVCRAPGVESFRFAPAEKIEFVAGQFLQVLFDPAHTDNKDLNKYLSFSCSPERPYIEVTKRLSDSLFSQRLRQLRTGDEIFCKAPLGNCIFTEQYKKVAFLIGGIGITPVISIIEYIIDKEFDTDVTLFYSNRTDEDIAFQRELEHWRATNEHLKVFYTVTDCQPKDARCTFGFIDKKLLQQQLRDYAERVFFIFGPPKMVEAMKALCLEMGCNKESIKTESFIGY